MEAGRFSRSISFPARKPSDGRAAAAAAKRAFRARCISMPSRTHPIAAHLADELNSLLSWPHPSSAVDGYWISDGLARLHRLLAGFSDVIQYPQAQDTLRRSPALAARLLDHFLCLADVQSSFRSGVLSLKQQLAASLAALRRRDDSRFAACLRAQRHALKDVAEIIAAVRDVRRRPQPAGLPAGMMAAEEAEAAGFMWDVAASVTEALETVSLAVSEICAPPPPQPSRFPCFAAVLRWRARATSSRSAEKVRGDVSVAEERWREAASATLREAEDALASAEIGSDLVFRSLVNVRVALLNIVTTGV